MQFLTPLWAFMGHDGVTVMLSAPTTTALISTNLQKMKNAPLATTGEWKVYMYVCRKCSFLDFLSVFGDIAHMHPFAKFEFYSSVVHFGWGYIQYPI